MQITGQDARSSSSYVQAIPRVIYSTIKKKSVRRAHFDAIENFRNINPEYKFVILDDNEAHDYVSSKLRGERIVDIFERSKFGPMQADILRVALMLFEGGVYIDSTKRLLKPLRQTIPTDANFVFAHEKNEIPSYFEIETNPRILKNDRKLIVQWCMMSSPNNAIFETMIESIERDSNQFEGKVFKNPKQAILDLTATHQFTRAVWKHLETRSHSIHYAGVDFGEDEYVLIKESYSRNPFRSHYASTKDKRILRSKKI